MRSSSDRISTSKLLLQITLEAFLVLAALSLGSPVSTWWLKTIANLGAYFLLLAPVIFLIFLRWFKTSRCSLVRLSIVGCSAIIILFSTIPVLLPFFQGIDQPNENAAKTLRIVYAQVDSNEEHLNKLRELITTRKIDLLALTGINHKIRDTLQIPQKYSNQIEQFQDSGEGLGVYSNLKTIGDVTSNLEADPTTGILAQFEMNSGTQFKFALIQTVPPFNRQAHLANKLAIRRVGTGFKHLTIPGVFVGGFNATPFSNNYELLTDLIGLNDAQWGYGISSSWHLFKGLGLQTDHAFVTSNIRVVQWERLDDFSDNHAGTLVGLILPAS